MFQLYIYDVSINLYSRLCRVSVIHLLYIYDAFIILALICFHVCVVFQLYFIMSDIDSCVVLYHNGYHVLYRVPFVHYTDCKCQFDS